jgi:heptosyltransferase-1
MKICIVKLSAMGDIVHAMISLQFIKNKYPSYTIDWIVEKSFEGVLANNPDINKVLPIELKKVKTNKLEIFKQISLLKEYSKNNYDIVIDAQGLIKSAIVARIVGNKIVNSYIVGFDKYSTRESLASLFYDKKVNIAYSQNVILRNLKVICSTLGVKVSEDEILAKKSFLNSTKNNNTQKQIVFIVGASLTNKMYPKEKFLELSYALNSKIILVWGNEKEKEIAQWIHENNTLCQIAPKGNLDDLKALLSCASIVIGADTGPTHMAWGLNVPSITIFGNTPSKRNTYKTKINLIVDSNTCVDPNKLDKNDLSIKDIDINDIMNKIGELNE